MASNKNSDDDLNLDDILDSINDEETSSVPEEAPEEAAEEEVAHIVPEEESEIQRQIREAKEELARQSAVPAKSSRPKPESQLSAEEKELRILQDRVAQKRTAEAEAAEDALETAGNGQETILIHFIINGFTAQSRVWQRGQEIEFVVGGAAHEQTMDRFGNSWLDLRNDPAAQIERYGAEYFREGPFPGLPLTYTKDLTDPDDIAAMQQIAAAEAKRNRAAPVIA